MQKKQIIVSLTSFPVALPFAAKAIQSILDGSVLPDKIVLYLTTKQFPSGEIPSNIKALLSATSIFEVRFCDEIITIIHEVNPSNARFSE